MSRLILLNGPPGCGKSTLARRYAEDHPLTLNLDIDRVRDLIGGWRDRTHDAGLLAREIALAAARAHLTAGHDVIVPQLLARPEFLDRSAGLAAEVGATFHEIVLMDSRAAALRRWAARSPDTVTTRAEVGALYDRLVAMLPGRAGARIVHSREGEIERTYREVLGHISVAGR